MTRSKSLLVRRRESQFGLLHQSIGNYSKVMKPAKSSDDTVADFQLEMPQLHILLYGVGFASPDATKKYYNNSTTSPRKLHPSTPSESRLY